MQLKDELTDEMINEALQNSSYATRNLWTTAIVIIAIIIVFAIIIIKVKDLKIRIPCAILTVVFIFIGVNSVTEGMAYKKAIENEEWLVVTDTVKEVKETKRNGKTTGYFMTLKEYGRVNLEDYSEAMKHSYGEQVYTIVIPNGNKYLRTGIAYSKLKYNYTGSHE